MSSEPPTWPTSSIRGSGIRKDRQPGEVGAARARDRLQRALPREAQEQAGNAARRAYIEAVLSQPCAPAVEALADILAARFPGAGVLLYGSGNSVLSGAAAESVLFDFYVIAPSYEAAYGSPLLSLLNRLIPPNVFYLDEETTQGRLRAKYAVLSIDHFERLVSKRTFHSYFWARFAQPCRIARAPEPMRARLVGCIETAIDVFIARARPLAPPDADAKDVWRAGLARSYRAELRAEKPGRAGELVAVYGDWPRRVTPPFDDAPISETARRRARLLWRIRSVQGGALSVLRLFKGMLTFRGGLDYIAWKISRHAGFALPVRAWERRVPLVGAFFVASRYWRMRARTRASSGTAAE
ncbi:hypothetical protein [Amphiplicatus metriothermophilus]|uniref:Uncharacterized protein n=1 Tax=Amphiplicatus metriothermophilus TaxID=1519374 RepID=A0A239PSP9_9PROT|nr:hypothetical protein [Amphiplicatus metriothermophilus]MBB5519240.1 hypothetical protein [Amphiplicatus metriothermophilus]SNT73309.1 hypothetical protein SAMN06297382_1707 [Amphiplicatus metriothermophilus]